MTWARYFKTKETLNECELARRKMCKMVHNAYVLDTTGNEVFEQMLYKTVKHNPDLYTIRAYTKGLCNRKTTIEVRDGQAYHITAEGEIYKKAADNDEPTYYQRKYAPIGDDKQFFTLWEGIFVVKPELLSTLSRSNAHAAVMALSMCAKVLRLINYDQRLHFFEGAYSLERIDANGHIVEEAPAAAAAAGGGGGAAPAPRPRLRVRRAPTTE